MGYYNQILSGRKTTDIPPSTILKYDLPQNSMVQLEVISGLGKIAFVVLDELQPTGNYVLKNQQTYLNRGIYLLRIKITTPKETVHHLKRIVLTYNAKIEIEKKVDQYYKITISN